MGAILEKGIVPSLAIGKRFFKRENFLFSYSNKGLSTNDLFVFQNVFENKQGRVYKE